MREKGVTFGICGRQGDPGSVSRAGMTKMGSSIYAGATISDSRIHVRVVVAVHSAGRLRGRAGRGGPLALFRYRKVHDGDRGPAGKLDRIRTSELSSSTARGVTGRQWCRIKLK